MTWVNRRTGSVMRHIMPMVVVVINQRNLILAENPLNIV